jgi:8-oxo-dGTP pyrophosphatase MutT (NUDIX family)
MRTTEAIVAVRRGDEILVVHRSPEDGGYWHLVSGGIEAGETAAEAASRELMEEVGLAASVEPLDFFFMYAQINVEAFAADAPAGWEPVLNREHDDYRWVSADEAVELLHWPEPREIVGMLS